MQTTMDDQVVGSRAMLRPTLATRVLTATAAASIVLAIPIIVMGFWLALRHHMNCIKFLEIPIIFIGLAIVLVSLAGIVGASKHNLPLVWVYLIFMFLLLLLLFVFTLFAFIVTSNGGAHAVPAATFLEYNLGEYSTWLQDQVRDPLRWVGLRACLRDEQVCSDLNSQYTTLTDFDTADLSPTQSGCCKPPNTCGFTFVRPTQWITAANPSASSDCALWSNSSLCFNCNTCKAGLLETVRRDWRTVARVCLAFFILLLIVYLVSWFAFLKGLRDGSFKRIRPGIGYSKPEVS